MSHFAYTRPNWTSGTDLYAAEMAEIDAKTFKAINGDEGGTWAPSSPITVGGSGMIVRLVGANQLDGSLFASSGGIVELSSGSFLFNFGLTAWFGDVNTSGGAWTFGGSTVSMDSSTSLSVNGSFEATSLSVGIVTVTNGLFVDLGKFTSLGGPLTVSGITNLSSTTNIHGTANLNGDTNINGTTYLSGNTTIEGATSLYSVVSCDGIGRVRRPAVFTISSGAGNISPTVATNYIGLNLTGQVDLTIDDTGALEGDEMYIINKSTEQLMYVYNTVGSGHGVLAQLGTYAGLTDAVRVQRISGLWHVIHLNHV